MGNSWRKYMKRKPITYTIAKELKNKLTLAEFVCSIGKSPGYKVRAGNFETDPDVVIVGSDENLLTVNNVSLKEGRPLTQEDVNMNRKVAIIGNDIVVKIFPNISPIGQRIAIKNQQFEVIGVIQPKGAILGQSQDNYIVIPITQFLTYYVSFWSESLTLTIKVLNEVPISDAMDETIGALRTIRNVKPWQENDFELETNESISEQFAGLTGFLSYFGFFCGGIALLAAGVGIMNIMLVSVKERTREIGIRKAVGAKRYWILLQFIIETITLCQIGGLIGILMGIVASAALGSLIGLKLFMPWDWVILSICICTLLGIVSGAYPAWRAAKLDPIDALRYE